MSSSSLPTTASLVAQADAEWSEVWSLYTEAPHVFRRVFNSLAASDVRIDTDARRELVHTFLLERARPALRTFQPARGELEPWLYVVFRRYVLQQLRKEANRRDLLRHWLVVEAPNTDPYERRDAALDVQQHFGQLTSEQQEAVRVYYGSVTPSLESAAKSLGLTTWKTRQLLKSARERLRDALEPNDIIKEQEKMTSPIRFPPDQEKPTNVVEASIESDGRQLWDFLDQPIPTAVPPEQARGMLEAASRDPQLADALAKKEEHLWLLLEADTELEGPDETELDEVHAAQTEVLVSARALLQRMDQSLFRGLEDEQPPEAAAHEFHAIAADANAVELRVCQALSEALLTVRAILTRGARLVIEPPEFLVLESSKDGETKKVPVGHLYERIAKHASLKQTQAAELWEAFIALLREHEMLGLETRPKGENFEIIRTPTVARKSD